VSRALALSDKQLQLVQEAARQVPVSHRRDFLNDIADELQTQQATGRHFSDADVMVAVQRNVTRWWGP
jgi:hypothetical protein